MPNSSFEEYYSCPTNPGAVGDNQLERCKYWYKPSSATTDYYNACQTDISTGVNVPNNWFGWQQAFQGQAYIGIYLYIPEDSKAAEYIQCKLLHPLKPCTSYKVRFWVSLGDFCSRATPTLGARLDTFPIKQTGADAFMGFELPSHINSSSYITDTAAWTLIEGIYLASGSEQYLTIGRFLDTTLYSNDNLPNITVACDSCFSDVYHENPAYYYVDSVSVVEFDALQTEKTLPNVLTANDDGINDYWLPIGNCTDTWDCSIYNRWGDLVFEFNQDDNGWNGNDSTGKELNEGVYYYILCENENKKTGFIQLIR